MIGLNMTNNRTVIDSQPALSVTSSSGLAGWLQSARISLGLTTYQTNRLFLIGSKPDGTLSAFERLFDGAMGLHATEDRLLMSTRGQLWQLDNTLAPDQHCDGYDKVYVPRLAHTTGNLDTHDVSVDKNGRVVFVNTLYSCLATLSDRYSFKTVWHPPFISRMVPEDRCHLNGLAMVDGEARYVTAISCSDVAGGWRSRRHDGGIVIDIRSNDIVASGLSMPHSPRYHEGKLWLLNSGTGELGYIDTRDGQFQSVIFCPGYLRGLAFCGDYAVVGLSKPRDNQLFSGLSLDDTLRKKAVDARCGLLFIDLRNATITHWLEFEGVVTELYDVQVIPNAIRPKAIGLKTDEIHRVIGFEENGQHILHTISNGPDTVPPPSNPVAEGICRISCQYQVIRNMDVGTLTRQFDDLTFPRFSRLAAGRRLQQPLITIVALHAGTPVAMIVAERDDRTNAATIISLMVKPDYRHRGVGTGLITQFETVLNCDGCQTVMIKFQSDLENNSAMEGLLAKAGWLAPQPAMLLCKGTMTDIASANWLNRYRLPESFEIFPWSELTRKERHTILARQRRDPWFPPELTPFQEEQRIEYLNSLGLRYKGEVVGWMITHRVAEDTIQYTSLFVRKELQRLGRAIPLLSEAIKRQMPSGIERGICQIHVDSLPMIQYMKRRIWPHEVTITELKYSFKSLVRDLNAMTSSQPVTESQPRGGYSEEAEAVG